MNGIIVRETEPFEKAIRRFSKTCERSGVLSELKKYRHYEKPSEKRKRKKNSVKQHLIREKRLQDNPYEKKTRKR